MAGSLSEKVFIVLRDRILDGAMKPNLFYTEQAVADELSISKATARDVLHRLCFAGYMERHPRKGYSVNMVLGEEFMQVQQVRFAVESLCVKLVIRNCSSDDIRSLMRYAPRSTTLNAAGANVTNEMQNQKFHTEIAVLSKNQAAKNIVFDTASISTRAAHNFQYLQNTPPEHSHEALVEAMLERDTERALYILRKHLGLDNEGL